MRYFVEFSYLGKDYHGWQNQPNAISVQEVLEKAFSTLLRTPLALTGAGRTDAGVHAKQMFAHFEVDEIQNLEQLVYRLNSLLPEAIAVHDIFAVHEDAHARFDAQERTYEYWVLQNKNPFYIDFAHYVKHPLDIGAMNDAAQFLLQFSDFECFSKTHTDVKTYLCDVKKAVWEIKDDKLVFTITADRFLRNMVRAVVGTLLDVGTGKIKPAHVKSIINSKNRGNAGPSVPAKGLYLTSVLYPKKITEKNG
ncbi:tRNA pseudouridine(38-40) synthase TruA [Zobellia sp. B3R18]|uniref:tRNA pseudouridine(38-40) synthase TruA n=1 Tax=Zobellia sp. B3R18 TaxID=2841568 RepID=UPI001C075D39|nr:tRNA pseudouridine(38-40) synthase TruA [Zobellia sp. B3R18]MBU2973789.1 tRNA pseudouridine(38-40) synthase TruA [Zobellia sp. B3R18]